MYSGIIPYFATLVNDVREKEKRKTPLRHLALCFSLAAVA